jgi:hypothetical protein
LEVEPPLQPVVVVVIVAEKRRRRSCHLEYLIEAGMYIRFTGGMERLISQTLMCAHTHRR